MKQRKKEILKINLPSKRDEQNNSNTGQHISVVVRGQDDNFACEMNNVKKKDTHSTHTHTPTKRGPDNIQHRMQNVISETHDRGKKPTIANTERIFMSTDCKLYVLFAFLLCFLFSTTHSPTLPYVSDAEFLPPFFTCAISSVTPFNHTTQHLVVFCCVQNLFMHYIRSLCDFLSLFFEMHVHCTHCCSTAVANVIVFSLLAI